MSFQSDPGLKRRTVLIQIGQAVIASSLPMSLESADLPGNLPAGVFLPSGDHLGHALMSSDRLRPIPPGCPTDYVRPGNQLLFFTSREFAQIQQIIELLLGLSSALAPEVAYWVDLRVASAAATRKAATQLGALHRALSTAYLGAPRMLELQTAAPERICREGLAWLAQASQSVFSQNVLSLSREQLTSILDSMSDARSNHEADNAGTRFFSFIKAEAIRGYYTSQAGLKELDFKGNAFYAKSPGCDVKLGNQ